MENLLIFLISVMTLQPIPATVSEQAQSVPCEYTLPVDESELLPFVDELNAGDFEPSLFPDGFRVYEDSHVVAIFFDGNAPYDNPLQKFTEAYCLYGDTADDDIIE